MLLHDGKESDDNLGGRTDKHLTLSTLLSVVDVVEAIGLRKFTLPISICTFQIRWIGESETHENGNTHGY